MPLSLAGSTASSGIKVIPMLLATMNRRVSKRVARSGVRIPNEGRIRTNDCTTDRRRTLSGIRYLVFCVFAVFGENRPRTSSHTSGLVLFISSLA